MLGALAGAVLGGAAVGAALFLLALPFGLLDALRRPKRSRCTCGRGDSPGLPPPALPCADSNEHPDLSSANLQARIDRGELDPLRVTLAGSLGFPDAAALGLGAAPAPIVDIGFEREEEDGPAPTDDLLRVLGAGLPPRLCAAWALDCARAALLGFEAEFHEDTRARSSLEAGIAALADPGDAGADALRESVNQSYTWGEGCRVFSRTFWDRVAGGRTRGQHARAAVSAGVGAVLALCRPDGLWANYPSHDQGYFHATVTTRCHGAQPASRAARAAEHSLLAAADVQQERQRQRESLARLILTWDTWDLDLDAWRARVEKEWAPRVARELKEAPFPIDGFVRDLPRLLAPWSVRGPEG